MEKIVNIFTTNELVNGLLIQTDRNDNTKTQLAVIKRGRGINKNRGFKLCGVEKVLVTPGFLVLLNIFVVLSELFNF